MTAPLLPALPPKPCLILAVEIFLIFDFNDVLQNHNISSPQSATSAKQRYSSFAPAFFEIDSNASFVSMFSLSACKTL